MQTIPPELSKPPRRRFRSELAAFFRDVRWMRLSPRRPGRHGGTGLTADWQLQSRVTRLLAWALFLWGVNIFALGPLVLLAAGTGGAEHRINLDNLPWMQAILWAPIVEELLFRYGLRRPVHMLWMVPMGGAALLMGPGFWAGALVALGLALSVWHSRRPYPPSARWRPCMRRYIRLYPIVFHLATLAFAGLHLANYSLNAMPWWLMPVLVLPQWLTGLALGWLRTRAGIVDAIVLHAIFNAGPVLLILLVMRGLAGG